MAIYVTRSCDRVWEQDTVSSVGAVNVGGAGPEGGHRAFAETGTAGQLSTGQTVRYHTRETVTRAWKVDFSGLLARGLTPRCRKGADRAEGRSSGFADRQVDRIDGWWDVIKPGGMVWFVAAHAARVAAWIAALGWDAAVLVGLVAAAAVLAAWRHFRSVAQSANRSRPEQR